jgi:hypothetical protein
MRRQTSDHFTSDGRFDPAAWIMAAQTAGLKIYLSPGGRGLDIGVLGVPVETVHLFMSHLNDNTSALLAYLHSLHHRSLIA